MANKNTIITIATLIVVVILAVMASTEWGTFPDVEVTLANDGANPVWFMCQMTDKDDSLYELAPNSTYRFSFVHVAFPMRWCYLYLNPKSHGFFWAYTVRSRCTKCFWSISRYPSLYRGDQGRWERQKLFMPPDFEIKDYMDSNKLDQAS